MKTLQNYTENAQTALFDKTGTFFAFSTEQFLEKQQKGIKYTSLGFGMICPTANIKELTTGLDEISKLGRKKDLDENGKKAIILRELINHEAFYTGETEDTVDALIGYGITEEEVAEVLRNNWEKYSD